MTPVPLSSWLSTPRIALREFVAGDFDELFRLDSDPRVMRYLNNGRPLAHADVRHALVRILDYYPHHYGLGIWRAALRESGAFFGWFALKYCGGSCDVEVGYRLLPEAWGRGLATEGAQALVRYALQDLGLFRVIGITHPDNKASQRVLVKCGLVDRGFARYYDRRVRLFALDRKPDATERRASRADPRRHVGEFPEMLQARDPRTASRRR